jgi:hypothetical protein|tara:strand:- start:154 stop:1476 length:1323 start_codon:yes stop_codon:yes gene_type:complete
MDFERLGSRQVVGDFDGGRLTSDAGALILREVDRRLSLIDALNACIPDPRDPLLTQHEQVTMLSQRIFGIALGYEDLNDHQTLRGDPALQVAARVEPTEEDPMASPSTLCRLENRIDRRTLVKLAEVFVEQFIAARASQGPPKELILDFDATDDPLHGHQEGRFFHGYYDRYCYLPLYVFCGDELLVPYLRPSNIDGAKHSRAILKLLVRRFRQVWPGVKIILRADSGFCRWKLMRWCNRHGVDYILGLARNPVLERLGAPWIQQAERQFEHSHEKQRVFEEFRYAASTWDRERRVIIKAERLVEGPNTRFVVTSLEGEPQHLYDKVYCQRGDAENRIKEQQLGLFAGRTSCGAMHANQFRLFLSSAAYVLLQALRRIALEGTELARSQVQTIRLKLLKVAARVVVSVRRVRFYMASSYPYQEPFRRLLERLGGPQMAPI